MAAGEGPLSGALEAQRMQTAEKKPMFLRNYYVLGLVAGTCISVLLFITQQKKHFAETVPLRFSDLLKVTQRVSSASNPRTLWQVRQRPKKAK